MILFGVFALFFFLAHDIFWYFNEKGWGRGVGVEDRIRKRGSRAKSVINKAKVKEEVLIGGRQWGPYQKGPD